MERPDREFIDELMSISRKRRDQPVNNEAGSAQKPMSSVQDIPGGSAAELLKERSNSHRLPIFSSLTATAFTEQAAPDMDGKHRKHEQPSVRVSGTQRQVESVRNGINYAPQNGMPTDGRVTLLMDVSFSDHSFIIGRSGKGSRSIMACTGCHVHFPDCNKNGTPVKSNQVSIAGPPSAVLAARQKIRERLPLSLAFLVDRDDHQRSVIWSESTSGKWPRLTPKFEHLIESLQNTLSITITWLPMDQHGAMVTVRGRRSNFERIREGVRQLASSLSPEKPAPPIVHLGVQVAPHHLSFVLGVGEAKAQAIMKATSTHFRVVPFRSDASHNIPTVQISGAADNVYKAWVAFMDVLPIVVCTDLVDSSGDSSDGRIGAAARGTALGQPNASQATRASGHQDRIDIEDLMKIAEMALISADDQEGALPFMQTAGSSDTDDAGLRSIHGNTSELRAMLASYEISLSLRLGQNSGRWKLIVKGPEKYAAVLTEINRALTNAACDPVEVVRKALLAAGPPSIIAPSRPLVSPSILTRQVETMQPHRLTSTQSVSTGRTQGHCASNCRPCQAFDDQEACEMYVALLKISGELVKREQPFGGYACTPGGDAAQRPSDF